MKFVDAKGLTCPEPVMMLHAAVRDLDVGERVEIIATDPSSRKDITNFCEFLGHTLDNVVEHEGTLTFQITKGK